MFIISRPIVYKVVVRVILGIRLGNKFQKMQGVNRSLRRSSASSSHQTFLNLEHRDKAELKRVIDFLQEQYEGLASELASKELQLKVARNRRMPSEDFELKNQEYEAKSQINQLKFKHMTELQQTMAEHQLEIDLIRNQFQQKLQRQYENFKREFSRLKQESSSKLEQQVMELSEKNIELSRKISHLQSKLREAERRPHSQEAQAQIKHLKKLVAQKQAQISRLQRQLRDSEQYAEEMKQKLSEKNKQIDSFVSEMNRDKSTSRVTFVQKTHNLKQEKLNNTDIAELSDQLIFIKEQNDRLRKLNDKYKGAVTEKENQIQRLGQKIAQLNNEVRSCTVKTQSLMQQVSQYQTRKKIFQSQVSRLNDSVQKGLNDLHLKQSEIKSLNTALDKLRGQNHVLSERVTDQESEKKRLEDIISRQNDKLGLLEEELRALSIKNSKKDQQIGELNRQIDHSKGQYKGLQIAFQTKHSEFEVVCAQNRQYIVNNQNLKSELSDLKRTHDELKRKLAKTEEDNADFLQSLKELKVQYQNVRIQNSALKEFEQTCIHLKSQIAQLEHQLKLSKQEGRKYIQETYKCKLDLEEALAELNQAEARVKNFEEEHIQSLGKRQLVAQINKYTQVVESTCKLNNQLNSEMKILKGTLSKLTQQKILLEKKLERVEDKTSKSRTVEKTTNAGHLPSEITRLQLLVSNLENQKMFFETKAEDAVREKEKAVNNLQKQIAELSSSVKDAEVRVKHQISSAHDQLSEAKHEIQRLKNELNILTTQNVKVKNVTKGQLQVQAMEMEGLRQELKRKTHENENLHRRWNALKQQQIQRLSEDKQINFVLESQLSACKTKLELIECSLKDRQGELQRLSTKHQRVIAEKEAMEVELDQSRIEQWKQRSTIESLESDKQSLLKELKSKELIFQQELSSLKSDNLELASNNQELAEYVKDLQKERNRLGTEAQLLSETLPKVQKQKNEIKEQLHKVELDLASARVQNESLKRKKPEVQSPKASFSQSAKYKQEIEKQKRLRKQLEEEIDDLKKAGTKQKQHKRRDTSPSVLGNAELEMEVKRLNEQIRVNGIQFQELLKYRSDLEMKLIQTGDELRRARQELSNQNSNKSMFIQRKDVEVTKMSEHIKQLEIRVRLTEDINSQLRKKEFEQQEKVTRILADNKTELTHYKLQNNRLEKENAELQVKVKQLSHQIGEAHNQKTAAKTREQVNQLREELKNVYGQIHSLNNLLIQKQNQISSLLKSKDAMSINSVQVMSPKEKKTLKTTEDCWKDMQQRIRAGQKEFNKTRALYN